MSDWPPPPLHEVLLFEMAWPGAAVLGVAAVMLAFFALRTGRMRLLIGAGLCAVLAGGNVLTATLVTTEREALRQRNLELVTAFVDQDRDTLADILAERVRFAVDGDPVEDLDTRAAVLAESEEVRRAYEIIDWGLQRNEAARIEGRWRTHMMVRASVRITGDGAFAGSEVPTVSTWQLHWTRADDGAWRLSGIDWLTFNRKTPPRDVFR